MTAENKPAVERLVPRQMHCAFFRLDRVVNFDTCCETFWPSATGCEVHQATQRWSSITWSCLEQCFLDWRNLRQRKPNFPPETDDELYLTLATFDGSLHESWSPRSQVLLFGALPSSNQCCHAHGRCCPRAGHCEDALFRRPARSKSRHSRPLNGTFTAVSSGLPALCGDPSVLICGNVTPANSKVAYPWWVRNRHDLYPQHLSHRSTLFLPLSSELRMIRFCHFEVQVEMHHGAHHQKMSSRRVEIGAGTKFTEGQSLLDCVHSRANIHWEVIFISYCDWISSCLRPRLRVSQRKPSYRPGCLSRRFLHNVLLVLGMFSLSRITFGLFECSVVSSCVLRQRALESFLFETSSLFSHAFVVKPAFPRTAGQSGAFYKYWTHGRSRATLLRRNYSSCRDKRRVQRTSDGLWCNSDFVFAFSFQGEINGNFPFCRFCVISDGVTQSSWGGAVQSVAAFRGSRILNVHQPTGNWSEVQMVGVSSFCVLGMCC